MALDTTNFECWERERTATPVWAFAVRLHATGCSLRETQEILRLFGVERSHQAILQWINRISDSVSTPPSGMPSQVVVDETAFKINGELSWLYDPININTILILDIQLLGRYGTDPAAVFLHGLHGKYGLGEIVFLVDGYGYQTVIA